MGEPIGYVPLEEQVKQDPHLSSIVQLFPEFVDVLAPILETENIDPNNLHSQFWLTYFRTMGKVVRGTLDTIGDDQARIDQVRAAAIDLYGNHYEPLIDQTRKSGFFQTRRGTSYAHSLVAVCTDPEGVELSDFFTLMGDFDNAVSQSS